MNMDFGTNKTLAINKKGEFEGTYFRDIYSSINGQWYRNSWKEFDGLKTTDQNIVAQIIIMLVLINMVLNVKHH